MVYIVDLCKMLSGLFPTMFIYPDIGMVYINVPRAGKESSAEMPARAHATKKAPKNRPCATKKGGKVGKKTGKRRVNANQETFVYILQSTVEARKSYVGVTNSLPRRLRQHNGQLAGGARFTRAARPWRFHAIFAAANRHDALSIEWKIKHQKRKSDGPGIEGKIAAACRFGKLVSKFAQLCGPHPTKNV